MCNSLANRDRSANHHGAPRSRNSKLSLGRGSNPSNRLLRHSHSRGDRQDRGNPSNRLLRHSHSRGLDRGPNSEFNRLLSRVDSPRLGGTNRGELDQLSNARRGRPSRYRLDSRQVSNNSHHRWDRHNLREHSREDSKGVLSEPGCRQGYHPSRAQWDNSRAWARRGCSRG